MEKVTLWEEQAPFLCLDLWKVDSITSLYIRASHPYLLGLRIVELKGLLQFHKVGHRYQKLTSTYPQKQLSINVTDGKLVFKHPALSALQLDNSNMCSHCLQSSQARLRSSYPQWQLICYTSFIPCSFLYHFLILYPCFLVSTAK